MNKHGMFLHTYFSHFLELKYPQKKPCEIDLFNFTIFFFWPGKWHINQFHGIFFQLQEFCLQHPITVVRGIAAALKMDCGLFSTKALLETNPRQSIEIKSQVRQDNSMLESGVSSSGPGTGNTTGNKISWKCPSTSSYSTLGKFGR